MTGDLLDRVRQILGVHARMPEDVLALDAHADLFAAGMSSHASVSVMLAIEDEFDLEIPDSMLTRRAFESIAAIAETVVQVQQAEAA